MKYTRKAIWFVLFGLLPSCDILLDDELTELKKGVFNEFWIYTDEYYSMFEVKQIDWDSIYTLYEPQIQESLSEEAFFDIMGQLMNELEDGHCNLYSPFGTSRFDFRRGKAEDRNFRFDIIEEHYFNANTLTDNGRVRFGFIRPDIGYIHVPDFLELDEAEGFDEIITQFSATKGLIFDLRDNGGGGSEPGFQMAGRFTEQDINCGREFFKSGPGRDDFEEANNILTPQGNTKYLKPVMVLLDRNIFSAANGTANYFDHIPTVTTVGDTTGGGGGIPRGFILSNGWHLRISSSSLEDASGYNVEFGIIPDVFVELDTLVTDKDEIIETALELLE